MSGGSFQELESYLNSKRIEVISLPNFNNASKGLQFVLLNDEEFNNQEHLIEIGDKKIPLADGGLQYLHEVTSIGLKLSTWLSDKIAHPGRILPRILHLTIKCVKEGFGSRHRAASIGTNLYFGWRIWALSLPSPVEGYGRSQQSKYFQKQFNSFQFFPILHHVWNSLRQLAKDMSEKMDYSFIKWLSSETNNEKEGKDFKKTPCAIGIFTCGNARTLAFANEPHRDTGDCFTKDEANTKLQNTVEQRSTFRNKYPAGTVLDNKIDHFIEYAQRFTTTLGAGVPTTCSYQKVKVKEDVDMLQFFVKEGLGCSVSIDDFVTQSFYGHTFVHNTSVCIGVDSDLKIWLKNIKPEIGYVFAWGGGGLARSRRNASAGNQSSVGPSAGLRSMMGNCGEPPLSGIGRDT